MSGVVVIQHLLSTHAPLIAEVPAPSILGGPVPQGYPMPAIGVVGDGGDLRKTLAMREPRRLHSDHVRVIPMVKGPEGTQLGTENVGEGYPGVRRLLPLILAACPNQQGTIAGVDVVAIIPDVEGPDFHDQQTAIYSVSQDFMVFWREPA